VPVAAPGVQALAAPPVEESWPVSWLLAAGAALVAIGAAGSALVLRLPAGLLRPRRLAVAAVRIEPAE